MLLRSSESEIHPKRSELPFLGFESCRLSIAPLTRKHSFVSLFQTTPRCINHARDVTQISQHPPYHCSPCHLHH